MTMVASFMPSLAFAAGTPHSSSNHSYPIAVDGTANWEAIQTVLAGDDAKYVEVVKEPTHSEKGLMNVTCKVDYCAEVAKDVEIPTINHTLVARDISLETFAAAMLAQKEEASTHGAVVANPFANKYAADKWVKDQKKANKCYVKNAKVCSCGYVLPYADETVGDAQKVVLVAHNAAGAPACTDWTCDYCKTTVKGTDHTPKASLLNSSGTLIAAGTAADKVSEPNCGHGTGYLVECKDCGKKVAVGYYGTEDDAAHDYGTAVDKGVALVAQKTAGEYKVKTGYVAFVNGVAKGANDTKFAIAPSDVIQCYKLNTVITEADCSTDTDCVMGIACTVCGEKTSVETIECKHDYEKTHVAATCDNDGKNTYVCKVCGHKDADESLAATEPKLAHNYKVTKVAASCTNATEYYVIECTTCSKEDTNPTHTYDGDTTPAKLVLKNDATVDDVNIINVTPATADTTKTKTLAWTGFDNELKGSKVMEFTFDLTATPEHKFNGSEVVVKEATCTTDEVWGKKCSVCNKVDIDHVYDKTGTALNHDLVKTETAATCGSSGFYTEQCSRCGLYKNKVGGAVDATELKDAKVVYTDKPLVKEGAKCTFDKWVVTKKPTVFEKGVEALVCSVCGADGHENEAIDKLTVAKASNTVKAGKKSFTVKATAANATGYRVYYKKAGAKSWKSYTKKTDSLSKTFSGLSKGKYSVKVRAYAKNYAGDGEVVWGATSATKTVKVK